MKKTGLYSGFVFTLILGILVGCGKAASPSPSAAAASENLNEPVTIRFMCSNVPQTCTDLLNQAKEIAKLPNVTIESHRLPSLTQDVAAGWIPDILNVTPGGFYTVMDAGLVEDMTPLIKTDNFSLSKFNPDDLAIIRKYDPKGGLFAVPSKANAYTWYGLVYNKDIFDKFSAPYPKDNMTWDEVIQLAKRVNRTDGGTQYHGLVIDQPNEMVMQMALNYSDDQANVTLSDPKWEQIFQILKQAHDSVGIPATSPSDVFYKAKNVAMFVGNTNLITQNEETLDKDLNWDVATYPRFSDMKQPIVPPSFGLYTVSKQSEHKKIAMKLIEALLSDQMQKVKNDPHENAVGKTKHMAALTNQKVSPFFPERYHSTGDKVFNSTVKDMFDKGLDVNTTMRELKDGLTVALEQAKSK